MKYRFILLDADNTLLDFDACEKEAFFRTMKDLCIEPTQAMYDRYSAINLGCWKELEQGLLTKEQLMIKRYERLAKEYSLSFVPADANRRYVSHLSGIGILMPGALEFVQVLSEKAKLYIVTNGFAEVQKGRFANNPLVPYIQKIFISEELGYSKPDRRFFEKATAQIEDFDPSRAIVIGDSLTSDIKGAGNAGIACIWFNPKGQKAEEKLKIDFTVSGFDQILQILEQGDIHEN